MKQVAVLLFLIAAALPLSAQQAAEVNRAFLYPGHWETRFELLLPLNTLTEWMLKPVAADAALAPADRVRLAGGFAAATADWVGLKVDDGETVSANAEVMFIDSSTAGAAPFPIDGEATVKWASVHVALSWTVAHKKVPESIEITLREVFPKVSALAVEVMDGSGGGQLHFTSATPVVLWVNEGRLPSPPAPLVVPDAPVVQVTNINLVLGAWIALGVALQGLLWWKRMRWPGGMLPFFAAWLIGGAMLYPMDVGSISIRKLIFPDDETLNAEAAMDVLHPLLANEYLAANKGDLEHSDTLRKRLADDLLIPNHKHLRATVSPLNVAVEVESLEITSAGFKAPVGWTVIGVAHHLGHPDQRVNKYEGTVRVEVVDEKWKITSLEITSHRQM